MQGKGDMSTYWLAGQEDCRKRNLHKSSSSIETPDVLKSVTRSSLKYSKYSKHNLNRRLSLESQKKIRFAPSNLKNSPKIGLSKIKDPLKNNIKNENFNNDQHGFVMLPPNSCLISKRNSCPCLTEECESCVSKETELTEVVTPKLVLEQSPPEKLSIVQTTTNHHHRNITGWRRLSRFSSFVSCLGSGEVNDFLIYEKMGDKNTEHKHLSVMGHSESEPFLPQLCYKYEHEKKNEAV